MLPTYDLHDGEPLGPPAGSHGRIAIIDLSNGTVHFDEPDAVWLRRHLGGGALGAHYLLERVAPSVDALDPGNVLVFAGSVVSGLNVPAVSKHTVVGKSPLTGGAGESQSVGTFAPALKRSGLDAVVIIGRAAAPVYVVVSEGQVQIRECPDLWGQDVADAHDALLEREGEDVHTAIIGVAGEKLIRYAAIVNDVRFMNCRTGLGAVMGSKLLKALVVRPTLPEPEYAYPTLVQEVVDDWNANNQVAIHNRAQREFGVSSWLSATEGGEDWPYVTGNYDQAVFDGLAGLSAAVLEQRFASSPPPEHHWIDYARIYHVADGPYRTDPRYGGCEGNSVAALGPTLRIDDPAAVLKLSELTYRYGLDPESLGSTLAWVMSGHALGYLPQDFAEGLSFNDADSAIAAISQIAHREGSGDLLAEGVARASRTFGVEAQYRAVTCKDKELPVHEPRNKPALALAYGIGPIGPDYCVIEHDWDYSPEGYPYILRKSHAFGVLEGTPESEHSLAKVAQVVQLQRWWSGALETLMFDLFAVAPARYMPPTHIEQLLRGVTGWDLSIHEIMRAGERRIVLFQEFNRRHGLTRHDDYLPQRMYDEPIPDGKYAGAHVDREWYDRALDLYYEMSGFDAQGWPLQSKLIELGLEPLWQTRLPG